MRSANLSNARPPSYRFGSSECPVKDDRVLKFKGWRAMQEAALLGAGGAVERDDAHHPALFVLGLEATESGCRWLLTRWTELKAVIDDENLAWQAPERFKAIRLLGIDSRDVLHAPRVIAILQACQMIDPDAGALVDEYWSRLGLEPIPDGRRND